MPKTQAPTTIQVPGIGTPFTADSVPDVFDERDRIYQPRLAPLLPCVDVRPKDRYVLTQAGSSCTGHAVASMVNAVLEQNPGPTGTPIRVSPYMLYSLARRYDEFEGEQDAGSSLRGALKGWYHHGLLPEDRWPSLEDAPDIDLDRDLADEAMRYPLGAFYRVHAFRIDDMQSAVNELSGIVASAAIHEGWLTPTQVRRGEETMHVIQRAPDAAGMGGHAFAIVGYNEIGFLVQNSWGRDWGRGGFATLPYDDWLATAYDAWVARPGVRSIVAGRRGEKLVTDTAGGLSSGQGPDLVRLQEHVVNLGNNGRLSADGQFRSSPAQVDAIFTAMARQHERWRDEDAGAAPRRIVLYAHGGLNSEATGLSIAQKHLNWWLNNRVYPVTFAWQTGVAETIVGQLTDAIRGRLPFGGIGFDLVEQFDRLVEKVAGTQIRLMWEEMKQNARRASEPVDVVWPEDGSRPPVGLGDVPGATLTAARLAAYCASSDDPVEVHVVGHSAGSIFLSALLPRLLHDEGPRVPLRSVTFLAPAIRADEFAAEAVPLLADPGIRFTSFALDDARELDDSLGVKGLSIYQKSLLYLVARGLERSPAGEAEVPLLGMERFAGSHLARLVAQMGDGELVWAPSTTPARSRTDARTHGGLDDDAATMTSVLLRILGHDGEPEEPMTYRPHAPLREEGAPRAAVPGTPQARTVPEERGATSPLVDALRRAGWRLD